MRRYLQLLKNIGLFGIASFASKFISFFLLPIYTKYLSTSEYALVDISIVIQSLIWPIFSLSLTDGLLRFCLDESYKKNQIFTMCTIMLLPGLIICGLLFYKFDFGLGIYKYRTFFYAYYVATSINIFFSTFARTIERIDLIVKNSVFACCLTAFLSILFLVVYRWGIEGYFTSLIISNFFSSILFFCRGKYWKYFTSEFWNTQVAKEILLYSIPMIPNSIFWWINSSLDKFCLTAILGLSAVGLYSAAGKISSALNMVTSVFSQAWGISTAIEYGNKTKDEFFSNVYTLYNIVTVFVASIVVFFSRPISRILFSKEFIDAQEFIPVLILAFFYNAYNIFYGAIFTAYKKTNVIFYTTGIGALINLLLNMLFIKCFGIIGAGMATLISNFVVFISRKKVVKKYVDIRYNDRVELCIQLLLVFLAAGVTLNISKVLITILELIILSIILISNKQIAMNVISKIRRSQ